MLRFNLIVLLALISQFCFGQEEVVDQSSRSFKTGLGVAVGNSLYKDKNNDRMKADNGHFYFNSVGKLSKLWGQPYKIRQLHGFNR